MEALSTPQQLHVHEHEDNEDAHSHSMITPLYFNKLIWAVENHGKKIVLKTWQTVVKIAKIMAKTRQGHGIISRARRPLYSL